MKTTTIGVPAPGPATVVECPWCAAPVELPDDADAMACPVCRVTVELAPPVGTARARRSLLPAA